MEIHPKELRIEFLKGQGPGGQRKNKVETACRITHIPTGITAYADTRSQNQSKKKALKEIKNRVQNAADERQAATKKAKRDKAIKDTTTIRTYDFSRGIVKDHRSKKTASIKQILEKGRLELLRPDFNDDDFRFQ